MATCPVCSGEQFTPVTTERGYHWVECGGCGFVKIDEAISFAAAVEAQGDETGRSYIIGALKKFPKKVSRARRRVGMLLRRHPSKTFLDIGCNLGFIAEEARRRGVESTGLEINEMVVDFARDIFPDCRFICSPLETADLPQEHFDLIYCSEVIEHVADFRLFLARIRGIMKRGGVLYLTTPHIREYKRRGYRHMSAPEHKFYFNNSNIERVLKECGFTDVAFRFNLWKGIELFATKP